MINKSKTQAYKDSWGHGDTGGPALSKKLLRSGKELQLSLPLPPSALHFQIWVWSRKPRRFSTDRILGKERRKGKDCSPPTLWSPRPCSPSFPLSLPVPVPNLVSKFCTFPDFFLPHLWTSLWPPGSTPCLIQPSHEH